MSCKFPDEDCTCPKDQHPEHDCKNCGLHHMSYTGHLDAQEQKEIRKIRKMGKEYDADPEQITWIQPYYDYILGLVPLDTDSLIDVGSGYGVFGYVLSKARSIRSLISVEPFDYDTQPYNTHYKMTWANFYNGKPDKADVIISTEMIEHLEKVDAINFLQQAKKIARKVIVVTPYYFEKQIAYDNNKYQVHRCAVGTNDFIKEGYSIHLIGTLSIKGMTARIIYHPRLEKILKIIGVKPTNIVGVWT